MIYANSDENWKEELAFKDGKCQYLPVIPATYEAKHQGILLKLPEIAHLNHPFFMHLSKGTQIWQNLKLPFLSFDFHCFKIRFQSCQDLQTLWVASGDWVIRLSQGNSLQAGVWQVHSPVGAPLSPFDYGGSCDI